MLAKLKKKLVDFLKRQNGTAAVEYAVMLALVIVVCILAIRTFGSDTTTAFNHAVNKISAAPTGTDR